MIAENNDVIAGPVYVHSGTLRINSPSQAGSSITVGHQGGRINNSNNYTGGILSLSGSNTYTQPVTIGADEFLTCAP